MNRLSILIAFVISLLSLQIKAHTITYSSFRSKTTLNTTTNNKIAVADPLGDAAINGSRKALVKLTYGRENQTDVEGAAWAYRITYDLRQEGRTTPLLTNGVLTIYCQNGNSVYDAAQSAVLDMPNGTIKAKIEITITSVQAAPTPTSTFTNTLTSIPNDVRLELYLDVERYDDITGAPKVEHVYGDIEKGFHTAKVKWDYLMGAESYELEWVYVDDQLMPGYQVPINDELFARATRIETSQNFYDLSVTYPSGKIYYRVRGLGRFTGIAVGQDYTHIKYSEWSASLCGTNIITVDPFSNQSTWTFTAAYSEEGKYKKVVEYYDNSLRKRQTLTNLSTEKVTLAATTLYDVEGRASVNVLPSPVIGDNTLRYKGILTNYKRNQFDKTGGTDMLPTTTDYGAGNYFSAGLSATSNIIYRNFIPDAEGYPMVQTRFMNDGTGRVAVQSGVGATYKIGSGRETQYFYNTPSETQLKRLFGKNVGDARFYKQNIVLDPNGQASVSYMNEAGKVIATAMMGNSPTNVLPINSVAPATLKESLNSLNRLNTEGGTSIVNYNVFNLSEGTGNVHRIDYNFNQVISSIPCPSCSYKLTIRVESPENSGTGAITPISVSVGGVTNKLNNQEFLAEEIFTGAQICDGTVKTRFYELRFEKTGTYKISKELTIVPPSAANIRETIFNNEIAEVGRTWSQQLTYLTNLYLGKVNPMECAQSCEEYARAYIDKYFPNDPQRYVYYTNKIKECEQEGKNADDATATDDCDNLREQILEQMLPGGCVFEDITKWNTQIGASNLPTKTTTGTVTPANLRSYLLQLNLDSDRDPVLEEELIKRHQEYGHYLWCIKTKPMRDFERKLGRMRFSELVVGNELNLNTISDVNINNTTAIQTWIADLISKDQAKIIFDADGKGFTAKMTTALAELKWRSEDECTTLQNFYNYVQCGSLANATTTETREEKWKKIIVLYLGIREKIINTIRGEYNIGTVVETRYINCWITDPNDKCVIVNDYRDLLKIDGNEPNTTTTWKNNNKSKGGILFEDDCSTRFDRQLDGYLNELKNQFPDKVAVIDGAVKTAFLAYKTYTCAQTNPANPYGFLLIEDINNGVGAALGIQTALTNNGMGTWIVKDRWARAWGDMYYNEPYCALTPCGEALNTVFTTGIPIGGVSMTCSGVTYTVKKLYAKPGGETTLNDLLENSSVTNTIPVIGIFKAGVAVPGVIYFSQYVNGYTPGLHGPIVVNETNCSYSEGGIPMNGLLSPLTTFLLLENKTRISLKTQSFAQTEYESAQQLYDNCIAQQQEYYKSLAEELWKQQLDAAVATRINQYNRSCISNVTEGMSLTRPDKEYQYTLYYYDQSGSLLQTVPPEGVAVLPIAAPYFDNNGKWVYTATDDIPAHTLRTRYVYNSLGQVIWQTTPDAGVTEFVYDYAQRLRFSQNAKQLAEGNDYSYTKYDDLGRVKEVGKMDNPTTNTFAAQKANDIKANDIDFPIATDGVLKEQTNTTYSDMVNTGDVIQNNTRNRVSSVKTRNLNSTSDDIVTYYDYDEHGNVKTLYHNITALSRTVKTEYKYDLISNKVTEVAYQRGQIDQFYHRYSYDADNRLKDVQTSTNGRLWECDARYFYYLHGPMARTELGHDKVQGSDYIYTVQGWIKAVNLPGEGAATFEPGKDGNTLGINRYVARDEISYVLGYNAVDYKPIDNSLLTWTTVNQGLGKLVLTMWSSLDPTILKKGTTAGLFNGNIAAMITSIRKMKGYKPNPMALYEEQRASMASTYQYDALHRIRSSADYRFDDDNGLEGGTWSSVSTDPSGNNLTGDNRTEYAYDRNGNITTLKRWSDGRLIDNLTYNYNKTGSFLNNNKLASVSDAAADITEDSKLVGELKAGSHAFTYDAIGNLISNTTDGISAVEWTVYGKVAKVTRLDGKIVEYTYDAAGNRLTLTSEGKTTVYVRDAQGNVLTTYKKEAPASVYYQNEVYLYGASRLGQYTFNTTERLINAAVPTTLEGTRGKKFFELSNHLGNVLSVITDQKRWRTEGANSFYVSTVVSATDYYPFGMAHVRRKFSGSTYRYGFNGKENDNSWGTEMIQDYGFRIYSPSIAKFLSVDPLFKGYAWNSTYAFGECNPIEFVDLDGGEKKHFMLIWNENKTEATFKFLGEESFSETITTWEPTLTDWLKKKSTIVKDPRMEYIVHGTVTVTTGVDGTYETTEDVTWTFATETAMYGKENRRRTHQEKLKKGEGLYEPAHLWNGASSDQRWDIAIYQGSFNNLEAEMMFGGSKGLWAGAGKAIQGLSSSKFSTLSSKIRLGVSHISDNVVIQGSRANSTARTNSDIDIAVKVDANRFDALIKERFGTPNSGSAKERTMLHAIETGKIQAGEAGLSGLRKELEAFLGMKVDISIIKINGSFDNGTQIPLKKD